MVYLGRILSFSEDKIRLTSVIFGRIAVIFKLLGSVVLVLCGGLYANRSQAVIKSELGEVEELISVFGYIKNEIEEFDTPLDAVLEAKGIKGGIDRLLASCSERAFEAAKEAQKLGRGSKNEELRICARIIERLESERKALAKKADEVVVLSRVKGYGTAAALIILFI